MNSQIKTPLGDNDRIVGWATLGVTGLAVLAWSACCILPLALSIAGIGLAWTAVVAEQRTWLTVGAAIVLVAAWWSVWRRRKACQLDAACAPPSRLTFVLLGTATMMFGLALIWQPLIEPWAMKLLLSIRK